MPLFPLYHSTLVKRSDKKIKIFSEDLNQSLECKNIANAFEKKETLV